MSEQKNKYIKTIEKFEKKGDYKAINKFLHTVTDDLNPFDHDTMAIHYINIAKSYNNLRDYNQAKEYYVKSLAHKMDPKTLYYLGIVQLHLGELVDGYWNYRHKREMPEHQMLVNSIEKYGIKRILYWDDIIDKDIIVTGSEGFGDDIYRSRILEEAKKYAKSITLVAMPQLKEFFAHNYPDITVLDNQNDLKEKTDQWVKDSFDLIGEMDDLFRGYVKKFETLPPMKLYTAINQRDEVGAALRIPRPLVGFCWQSSNAGANGPERSFNESFLRTVKSYANMASFQLGHSSTLADVDYAPFISNFMDTANLLVNVDKCISCDTAMAHIALSMGKPTAVVYKNYLDWRFKVDLYPDAKLLSINDRNFADRLKQFVLEGK